MFMVKVVKYTCRMSTGTRAACTEQLAACETKAAEHVCFEDGGGAFVCKSCFDKRVNEGVWTTDSAKVLLAS
jgi:hypothetical protein